MKYSWTTDRVMYGQTARLDVDVILPAGIQFVDGIAAQHVVNEFCQDDINWYHSLTHIDGVESIAITHKYTMIITKGIAFEWEPIKAEVLAVMKEYFSPHNDMVNINPQDIKL
jgi:phosphosulfolactate synthase (CoM biosynthesis protein A)